MIFNEDDPFPKIVITHKQIDEIIKRAGVNTVATSKLADLYQFIEEYINAYLTKLYWANQLTPSALVKRFDNIASLSKRLISQLKEQPGVPLEIRAFLNRGLFDRGLKDRAPFAIETLIANLHDLKVGAEGAVAAVKIKKSNGMARHTGDQPLQDFLENLNGLWIDFFDLPPLANTGSDGESGGPYLRFVCGILTAMRESLSQTSRSDPTLRSDLNLTPNAVRQRLRKTSFYRMRKLIG